MKYLHAGLVKRQELPLHQDGQNHEAGLPGSDRCLTLVEGNFVLFEIPVLPTTPTKPVFGLIRVSWERIMNLFLDLCLPRPARNPDGVELSVPETSLAFDG